MSCNLAERVRDLVRTTSLDESLDGFDKCRRSGHNTICAVRIVPNKGGHEVKSAFCELSTGVDLTGRLGDGSKLRRSRGQYFEHRHDRMVLPVGLCHLHKSTNSYYPIAALFFRRDLKQGRRTEFCRNDRKSLLVHLDNGAFELDTGY